MPDSCTTAPAALFKQMPLLAPTGRRNQAVYSTSAPTLISLSSRIQAPHIMGRWNTHWDLTSSAVPDSCTTAPAALFKQMPLLAPTGRRNQAVYSTSAPPPISLSSRIQAPHIMGRWNTHWDLTSSALPDSCTTAPAALFQTDAAPRTDRPSQSSSLLDLCTDTNQPQLADPGTAHHGPLEYALGPHLQCPA